MGSAVATKSKSKRAKAAPKLPKGWAYKPEGFTFQYDGETKTAVCQAMVRSKGDMCGKPGLFVRTTWNGSVVFSCGNKRHREVIEDAALPRIAQSMGSRGYVPVIMGPGVMGPDFTLVKGARKPHEHPVHFVRNQVDGKGLCLCGAETPDPNKFPGEWTGGKPLDTPWWER